jgi:hypothetical protein
MKPEPRIEGLRESGLDTVEEGHCVRDTVEGQSARLVIQVLNSTSVIYSSRHTHRRTTTDM